jgi:hypothetical protein
MQFELSNVFSPRSSALSAVKMNLISSVLSVSPWWNLYLLIARAMPRCGKCIAHEKQLQPDRRPER